MTPLRTISEYSERINTWFDNHWTLRKLRRQGPQGMVDHTGSLRLLILSSGRSGSTLLRRILQTHPSIHIPPESEDLIPRSTRLFLKDIELPIDQRVDRQLDLIRSLNCMTHWQLDEDELRTELIRCHGPGMDAARVASAAHRVHARLRKPDAHVLGDKTPLLLWYIHLLDVLYPKAIFICLVRHPLDMISSMANMNIHGRDLDRATQRWVGAARLIRKLEQGPFADRIVRIRYEDLVEHPEEFVTMICNTLGLESRKDMSVVIPQDLGDTVLEHHSAVALPVNSSAIGAWKERLRPADADRIWEQCAQLAEGLGYSR